MAELANPIRGPLEAEVGVSPDVEALGFDFCAGGHFQISSSITAEGSGYQFCGKLNKAPNARDLYWLGFQYSSDQSEAGDFYVGQRDTRYSLLFGRGERSALAGETLTGISTKNWFVGFRNSEGDSMLELGSDIAAYNFLLRPSRQFGISIEPYVRLFSGIPFEDRVAEERSLLSLQAGINVNISYLDWATTPPQSGLNDYDVTVAIAAGAHRLGRNYGMARALTGPSAQAQDYTDELFGEGTSASARLEDIALFQGLSNAGAAGDDALDTELQLRATPSQRGALMGTKAALTAAAFGLSLNDQSTTMLTQGFGGGLQLVGAGIALGNGLENQTKARDFLLIQSLIDHLVFATAWGMQDEKAGAGLLQGAHQATLSLSLSPDPGKTGAATSTSRHGVYEWVKDGGSFIGYQQTTYLPSAHLYTRFRLLGQTAPAPELVRESVREGFDDVTGRDPLQEGAKAKTQAALGGEVQVPGIPLSLSGGLRSTLAYGEGPKPMPGIGAEGQVLLTIGDKTRFELGAGVFGDYLGGQFQPGVTGIIGFRTSF